MTERKKGVPIQSIPEGPRSDLGAYLYAQLLRKVVLGIIDTTIQTTEFAHTQSLPLARKLRSTVRRLSKIGANAAAGELDRTNFTFPAFTDLQLAESFAEYISVENSEIIPVPSSITNRLHDPHESALDGMARQSRVPGLTTIVTEVSAARIGSQKRYATVKLVGRSHLKSPR